MPRRERTGVVEQLAMLRDALLADAERTASAVVAAAEADAERQREEARREADRLLAAARERGRVQGLAQRRRDEAAAAHERRRADLASRREAYERLRALTEEAVRARLAEPGCRAALEERLRRLLPGSAVLPSPDGGLLAEAGDRGLDASVATLTDQALARVDGSALWSGG